MKPILYVLLLILSTFINSCKKFELFSHAENVTITGTVLDTNNNLLDSVEVTLYRPLFMSSDMPVERKYSKKGVFMFDFSPEEIRDYWLDFEKKGYKSREYEVSISKEFQKCIIIMERATI